MTTDTVGGVWTFTQELAAGLLELGCAVALVSVGRKPSPHQATWAHALAQHTLSFSFHCSPAPLEWMQANQRACTDAAPLLLKLAHTFRADVLHANQFCFGALPLALPKAITAHSDVLSWTDACRDFPLQDTPWLRRYRTLVSQGLQGADAVMAPTQWMLQALSRNFPLPPQREVIPNGRDLPAADSTSGSACENARRKLQAVTAGRLWDEAKGLAMLSAVDSPMPLWIAGETHSEDVSAPQSGGRATLLGPLEQASLFELFTQSAIYICPSRYEPFGLAPLEAALCGCAVLANDLPSLREVWAEDALYFSDGASLSALLHLLHRDPHALSQAQARSQARARTFTRRAMATRYLQLFQSLQRPARQPGRRLADVA